MIDFGVSGAAMWNAAMQEYHDAMALSSKPPSDERRAVVTDPVGVEFVVLNTSGITPTENKVLILPKEVEEAASEVTLADGSKIKIYKPVESAEKEKWATMEGTLIARSPLAFNYASEQEWAAANAEPPKPGMRILFAKYSGVRHKGRDGVEYVIANDKDVLAILED
jgi:co-chaperonin GroES (HSP10)